jgi:hypothetical protein
MEVEAGVLHDVIAELRDVEAGLAGIDLAEALEQDALADATKVTHAGVGILSVRHI